MPGTKYPQHKNLIIMFKWMLISPENCQKTYQACTFHGDGLYHPVRRRDVLSLLSRGGGGGVQVGGP